MAGGKIKQTVETKFESKGAAKVAKDTETIGKKQTRLGQASASTGRQFSAQASGMGGLVAAYAGAAATTFALQQAFAALNKAAQFEQIIQGTNTFTAAFGESATSVLGNIKQITEGQLSLADAAKAANLALSAGFGTAQLESLTAIATKASRALGVNLTDAFNRVVRGAAKLEPELLDELGIFTRIDPAVEAYAAAMNKSVGSLTNFERRQAFVNAVIEEGTNKFSAIDTSTETSAQALSRFAATFEDIALQIGAFVADVLQPIVNYLSGSLGPAFGTIGIVSTLVFSKMNQVIGSALTGISNKINSYADTISTSFIIPNKEAKESLKEVAEEAKGFNQNIGAGLGPLKAKRNELINLSKEGKLSINQGKELNEILSENTKKNLEEIASLKRKKGAVGVTKKQTDAYTLSISRLDASNKQNRLVTEKLTKAISTQGIAAKIASGGVRLLGTSLAFVTRVAGGILKLFNIFTLLFSVLSLIGPAILKLFGIVGVFDNLIKGATALAKAFFGIDDASKQMKMGISGIADSLVNAQEEAKSFTKATLDDTFLFWEIEIEVNKKDLSIQVQDALESAFKTINAEKLKFDFTKRAIQQAKATLPAVGTSAEDIAKRSDLLEKVGVKAGAQYEASPALQAQEKGLARIAKLDKIIVDTRKLQTQQLTTQAKMYYAIIINALEEARDITQEQAEITGLIAMNTGISASKLNELVTVSNQGLLTFKDQLSTLELQFVTITNMLGLSEKELANAKAKNILMGKLAALETNRINALNQLNRAELSRENIAKRQNELLQQEVKLYKRIQLEVTHVNIEAAVRAYEQWVLAKKARQEFNAQANAQSKILKVHQLIRKSFSSALGAADKLTGFINEQGKIAETDLEISRNKYQLLIKTFDKTKAAALWIKSMSKDEIAKLKQNRIELADSGYGKQAQLAKVNQLAAKAITGLVMKTAKEAAKLTLQYEKQTKQLEKQMTLMKLTAGLKELKIGFKLKTTELKLEETILKIKLKSLQRTQKQNELDRKHLDTLREVRKATSDTITGGVAGDLFSDRSKREIEIRFKKEELNALLASNAARIKEQKATNRAQHEIALKQFNIARARYFNEAKLIKKREAIDLANINFRKIELVDRNKQTMKQAEFIKEQLSGFTTFNFDFAKTLTSFLDDFAEILGLQAGKGSDLEKYAAGRKEGRVAQQATAQMNLQVSLWAIQSKYNKSLENLKKAIKDMIELLNVQLVKRKELSKIEGKINQIQRDIASKQYFAGFMKMSDALKQMSTSMNTEILKLSNSLADLEAEAARTNNVLIHLAVTFINSFGTHFQETLEKLFTTIREGTYVTEDFIQSLKNMGISMIEDLQSTLTKELIVDPIKDSLGGFFRGVFNMDEEENPQATTARILSESVSGMSPLHVKIAGGMTPRSEDPLSAGVMYQEQFGEMAETAIEDSKGYWANFKEQAEGTFTGISGVISASLGALIGSKIGGTKGAIIGAIAGPIIKAGVGAAIKTWFPSFAAAGGPVHMAAGGQLRDRVPAMLEPGEFVIRKPMAKAIGGPALSGMNSTGRGLTPNIEVVVKNEGTPKDAQAKVRPQMDIDKMVVEIVTRDMRNNGPIRKTMRGE